MGLFLSVEKFSFSPSISTIPIYTAPSIKNGLHEYICSGGKIEVFEIKGDLYFSCVHIGKSKSNYSVINSAIFKLNDQLKKGFKDFKQEPQTINYFPSGVLWGSNSPKIDYAKKGDANIYRLSDIKWCLDNRPEIVISVPLYAILIKIDDECLCIKNREDFLRFNKIYGDGTPNNNKINWSKVVRDGYASILIMQYFWEFRISHGWYSTWDSSSVVVFSPFNKKGEQIVFTRELSNSERKKIFKYPRLKKKN